MTEDEFKRQMSADLPVGRNRMRQLSEISVKTVQYKVNLDVSRFEMLLELWGRTGILPAKK